jgi:hypothetical protein
MSNTALRKEQTEIRSSQEELAVPSIVAPLVALPELRQLI